MFINRLRISGYKNIRDCEIEFTRGHLINAVIGSNGSGKSNLIEAILRILVGVYFEDPPGFEFRLEYEAQNRKVIIQREGRKTSVEVDGVRMPLDRFAQRLRDGPAQVFYPETTLVYYSGECPRVKKLVTRYRRHFQKLIRTPATDRLRPLFIQSSNEQSQIILLALFAHGHTRLLEHLGLSEILDVRIVLRSPAGFDPKQHEPKLWNTEGAIRRIVAALDETSSSQVSLAPIEIEVVEAVQDLVRPRSVQRVQSEERVYCFSDGPKSGIRELARRLHGSGDNVYLAIESLRARDMFRSVTFRLRGRHAEEFSFEQLSEGEKQLLAVIGAITLAKQRDNLVLLDEPDTHLNPHWSWDYPGMLTDALGPPTNSQSTVLMATHDPVMISGMVKEQVLLAHKPVPGGPLLTRPHRNPRGQGIANILCSTEFFGLPSSLDKETQKLLDERLAISVKKGELTKRDKARLKRLNEQLEISPGLSERDPNLVAFLRQQSTQQA